MTPRHEAPADPCASHRSMGFHIDPCCPHCEAPAEGAGEVEDAQWLLDNYGAGHPRIQRIALNLRARSSAPEAREGEPVGWKCEVFGPEGRSRSVRGVIGPKPNVAAPVGGYVLYDALYTHPAAPSADKLRTAVEALSWSEKALERYVDALGLGQTDDAALHALYLCADALAALSTPDALKGDAK